MSTRRGRSIATAEAKSLGHEWREKGIQDRTAALRHGIRRWPGNGNLNAEWLGRLYGLTPDDACNADEDLCYRVALAIAADPATFELLISNAEATGLYWREEHKIKCYQDAVKARLLK